MACIWLLLLLLMATARLPRPVSRISLIGSWEIRDSKQSTSIEVISGADMFSALWTARIINDPLSDQHDSEYRSYAWEDWTFQHIFRTAPKRTQNEVTELCCDGVDTFCDVALNDIILGTGNSSFLSVCWDISQYIRPDDTNELKLACKSTLRTANRIASERRRRGQPKAPPDCWPDELHGECHINLVRTTPASTGWDWGPAFPIQGFWHPPRLITSPANIRLGEGFKFYSFVSQNTSDQIWSACASVEVLRPSDRRVLEGSETLCISVMLDSWSPPNGITCFAVAQKVTQKDVMVPILTNSEGIEPWWPNGMFSGPRTYELYLTLTTTDGFVLDRAQYSVGFREVQLIEKPVLRDDPDAGLSFYLQINGVPVFAKGANWIPHRLLPGRVSGFMYNSTRDPSWDSKRLLRSTAMTGMNIVRVWGGGRYEPEEFYREADRLGLMIWHDMMFAVFTYPSRESPDPLDTVEKEVRRQVRRLHSHPSIVVWATDNEVRQAIMDNWYGGDRTQLLAAFQDRFVESVARVITEQERVPKDWIQLEESLKYHPRKCLISSPSNGIVTEQAKGTDRNPQDPRFGDVHYYNYYGNLWLETVYPVTRFTSEFGIQSLPSALAWSRSLSDPTEEVHWDINGSLMKHRQHRAANELFELAAKLIGQPTELSDMKKRYIRWAYLTQLNQMMSYRAHINRLMRHQCRLVGSTVQPDEKSSMGAMYWQLNDVWSAPTWSTIDAAGQWKMAHYGAVTECFRSRRLGRVAVHVNGEQLEVDWIPPNQSKSAVVPDVFVIRCYIIMSLRPTAEWRINVDWQHYDTSCPVPVLTSSLSSMDNRCNWTDSNVSGRIVHVSMEKEGEVVDGESYTLLETPAEIKWPKRSKDQGARVTQFREIPKSEVDPQAPFTPTSVYALTVETILPELFVWLELNYTLDMEYWFSENAFNLLTTSSRWIHLYVSSSRFVSPERIHSAIILNTLTTIREEHET